MDFLDPKKKRAHHIRLYIGYALMSIAVLTIAFLMVFQAYGYNYNFKTGDITQNGLLFVDAHPDQARVILNGRDRGLTDKRLILKAGSYELELQREGYRSWQRRFMLDGGEIERFSYPFLFPEKFVPVERQLFRTAPSFASQSPDQRWLVIGQPHSPLGLSLTALNSGISTTATLNLPKNLFTTAGSKHVVEPVEWAKDNQHIVVKHVHDAGTEFVLIDIQEPANSKNLSSVFAKVSFTDISLFDKRFDRYYLYNENTQVLRTADLSTQTTAGFLDRVLEFRSHGDNAVLYATTAGAAKGRVLINVREGNETFTVRDFPANSKYLLDIARFDSRWYIIAGAAKEDKVYVLRDPVESLRRSPGSKIVPAAILPIDNPQFASFSSNARFVAVQAGSSFATYDAETDSSFRYDTELELAKNQKAAWMDGHRLTLTSGNLVHIFDYDGINSHATIPGYNGTRPYFDSDYQSMYSFAPSEIKGRAALVQAKLTVDPE